MQILMNCAVLFYKTNDIVKIFPGENLIKK